MNWSITGGRPVYLQLIEQMERAIVAGEYQAGARLPGVRELAAEAAVNPNTMQRALQELEARGLINTQRTAGRTVTGDEARIAQLRRQLALRQAAAFLSAMRALGYEKPETLALLEGLEEPEPPSAQIPDASAGKPGAGAGTPDLLADPPDASVKRQAIPSDARGTAETMPGISANTPNIPSFKTGRK